MKKFGAFLLAGVLAIGALTAVSYTHLFTINTYRTDTEEKIDETFSIAKVNESDNKNQTDNTQTDNKKQPTTAKKNTTKPAEKAVAPKKAVVKRVKSLGKKKIKITVKKSSKQVSGYEVILSTKKNLSLIHILPSGTICRCMLL